MHSLAGFAFAVVTSGVVLAQSSVNASRFAVAYVHRSTPVPNWPTDVRTPGGVLRGGRYDWRAATMLDLISVAYSVEPGSVWGGPNWLELDRFDLAAKVPPFTSLETIRLMLQALLAERFDLVVHRDKKPVPTFLLRVGKGKLKLKRGDGSGNTGCRPQPQRNMVVYTCRNITMEAFAQRLPQMARAYITNPVVDSTGLKGAWNFDLRWNARYGALEAGAEQTTIFNAIEEQLGLTLELGRAPAPVLVIDSAKETPIDNPPDVTQLLPPRETEFEVAAIKPSRPDEVIGPSDAEFDRNARAGRLELQAFPLKLLIATAWNIDFGHIDEMLVGAPKWVGSARFDVAAKMSPTPTGSHGWDADLRMMLRSLLSDRFRMKTHYEDRVMEAYTLVATKPKLKKAAPPYNRADCKKTSVIADDKNPGFSWLVTCRNVTITQFAALLRGLADDYLAYEVPDATGLTGTWDFTMTYSPRYLLQVQSQGSTLGAADGSRAGSALKGTANDVPVASEPAGAVSLFEAIQKQLGLKLEKRKRTMPVLVIDHVDEHPTDN